MSESVSRDRLVWLIVIAALTGVYAATATWGFEGQTRDSLATAVPAWNLVENGSLDLTEFRGTDAWFAESRTGYFTNRTPGVILLTSFGYLLASPWVEGFVFWPATLVAVLTSTGAVALLVKVATRLSDVPWLMGAAIIGLGTAFWGIAADQLWPHGPAALMVAAAVYFLHSDRQVPAGVALAVAILIRPPVAVIAAVLGIGLALSERDWRPIRNIGVPAGLGALAFLAYSWWMFGSMKPTTIYDTQGGLGGPPADVGWLGNFAAALFSPHHGLLIWSTWVGIGIFALIKLRPKLPSWALPSLWAALAYVGVHSALNRASGGLTYNYRYGIEAMALIAPFVVAALWASRRSKTMTAVVYLSILISVGLQFTFVMVSDCVRTGPGTLDCSLFGI